MSDTVRNVLFLCTHNSARSIMAEAILNGLSMNRGRFHAFSAGSQPSGSVQPLAIELLTRNHLSIAGVRSKSWDEFAQAGSPEMHFVFTVCDDAAQETCPVWPSQPMTAHWGIADPSTVEGDTETRQRAYFQAFHQLQNRISLFANLPIDKLDRLSLQAQLHAIGKN
ncbi:MAG: arsenate reductase ArsC [Betaproteobacteria bacterium]|nr:MAG: arsenate reductase ArsC [Betaproteobacteria bacterium]